MQPKFLAIVIYVDDILIRGDHRGDIQAFKDHVHSLYTIKDLGLAKYFLGLEITQTSAKAFVSQSKYILDMLVETGLTNTKESSSPFSTDIILHKTSNYIEDPNKYRRLVRKLLYLGFTRPDISFITQQLSQFMQSPQEHHMKAAIHVLRYLKGTLGFGLHYPTIQSNTLQA